MTPKILKLEKEQDKLQAEYLERNARGLDCGVVFCHILRNSMALNRERAKLAVKLFDPTTQVKLDGYRSLKYGPLIPTVWDKSKVVEVYNKLSDHAKKHLEGKI